MIKRELTHCLWMTWVAIALLAGSVHGGSVQGGGVNEPTVLPYAGVVSNVSVLSSASLFPNPDTDLLKDGHPYYVSLINMYWNDQTRTYQVSIRLFWDDLENALEERYGEKTYLATEWEVEQANEWIFEYLGEHTRIWAVSEQVSDEASGEVSEQASVQANNQPLSWTWIGREDEMDVAWCYLESEPIDDPKAIELDVSIFHELFRTQTNIVYLKLDEEDKNMLFRRGRGRTAVQW